MSADEIIAKQGWNDDTMRDLRDRFFTREGLHSRWEDYLEAIAAEENVECAAAPEGIEVREPVATRFVSEPSHGKTYAQIEQALDLYLQRGEFDLTVGSARECLARAGYTWSSTLRLSVDIYIEHRTIERAKRTILVVFRETPSRPVAGAMIRRLTTAQLRKRTGLVLDVVYAACGRLIREGLLRRSFKLARESPSRATYDLVPSKICAKCDAPIDDPRLDINDPHERCASCADPG